MYTKIDIRDWNDMLAFAYVVEKCEHENSQQQKHHAQSKSDTQC